MQDAPRNATVDWRAKRARPADASGYVRRDGVRTFWEAFGSGEPAILLLPTWSVLHAAHGRFQIADLARRHRVITFDGRGNGRSDRPIGPAAYTDREFVADAIAVLDASGTDRAVVVGCSHATQWLLRLAAEHPSRVLGAVSSGTNLPLASDHPSTDDVAAFDEPYVSTQGWAKWNAAYWRDHYEDFLRFFFEQVWTEPHSRSVIEDAVGWGLETTPQTMIDSVLADGIDDEAEVIELAARADCPFLVIHGANDAVTPVARSVRLAEVTGGRLEILDGAGHCPGNREPVWFDTLIHDFAASLTATTDAQAPRQDPSLATRRILIVPGDDRREVVERDLAMADALRVAIPGVQIEWLAPDLGRDVLERRQETVHPASRHLLHDVRTAGQRLPGRASFRDHRRLDETDFANYMVFHDVVGAELVDLVVADSAWHIDRYLPEDPAPRRFAYAWLADAVGWPPARDETALEADYRMDANSALIERLEQEHGARDLRICLADPATTSDEPLGLGLPSARALVDRHFMAFPHGMDQEGARRIATALAGTL